MKATAASMRYANPLDLRAALVKPVVTNPEAIEVRRAADTLMRCLQQEPEGTVVPVSFAGLRASASCIAALLAPAIRAITRGEVPGRYLLAEDPEAANEWEADAALRKQSEQWNDKLVCAWKTNKGTELIGAVDRQIRATYGFVVREEAQSEGTTARALAEEEGITIQAASNRFAKAAMLGLLHPAGREAVAGGGSQKIYVPVG